MNKKLKYLISVAVMGMGFLFTASSCSSANKYLNGEVCGKVEDQSSTFYKIRNSYIEKFSYQVFQTALEDENVVASAYKDEFTTLFAEKYTLTGEEIVNVKPGSDAYTTSHYLFVYYSAESYKIVNTYINTTITDSTKAESYINLINLAANGKTDSVPYNIKYAYFPKVGSTSYDEDAPEVTYNGETKALTSIKTSLTNHSKACLVFDEGFVDPQTENVIIPKTTWKDAWNVGFLYGLFVYPMAWLINLFVTWFGSTGWGQVFAILVVTFILKIAIFLVTFKSQSSTQKMQDIQPEILKIQAKYGQAPSPEDRQKMSMELMAVYQKYGIKPLAPFASLLITFPVFIAMYRAVMYLGVLRTGNIAGVTLGNTLSSYIIGEYRFKWFAILVFVVMAATQILSMKLPQLLNKKRLTREAKAQQKQTNMMTNIMMIMILVMGFMMPVTMSVYWIASAVVGMVQSLLMHKLNNASKNGRYKVKKVETKAVIPQGYKTK